MAYARYDRTCEWYIFWYSTKADQEREARGVPTPREEEKLAVWHDGHRGEGPILTYREVREMLVTSDFSRLPGYRDEHRAFIIECFEAFVTDVDGEHERAS